MRAWNTSPFFLYLGIQKQTVMKVTEDINVFPPRSFYENVDQKFLNFTNRCRVLPVPYFSEYNTYFELKRRFEPGESKHYPNGGFEVYGPEGSLHSYDLDQVIVHPFHLGMTKFFSKSQNATKEKVTTGPKGKRGRPRSNKEKAEPKVYVPTGGKRGRPSLSPDEKAKREAKKVVKAKASGGKKGRPKKQVS